MTESSSANTLTGKLGVIGAGVMGKALISGLLNKSMVSRSNVWAAVRTETTAQAVRKELDIPVMTDYHDQLADTDVLLLCVKPSGVGKVINYLIKNGLKPDTLIISTVAGTSLETMQTALGQENPVIRAMPNTPCIVGQGMTVISPGSSAKASDIETALSIFNAVGQCIELEETHFDAVTGLGGSGPAYLYLVMEALADGGVRVGLPREVAMKIVTQTVLGAAAMVQETGQHPAALRDDVTTPAGCTIAGLLIMEDGKIRSVLARAVEEAATIAGQLGRLK